VVVVAHDQVVRSHRAANIQTLTRIEPELLVNSAKIEAVELTKPPTCLRLLLDGPPFGVTEDADSGTRLFQIPH
jgi:hypothetical protein